MNTYLASETIGNMNIWAIIIFYLVAFIDHVENRRNYILC